MIRILVALLITFLTAGYMLPWSIALIRESEDTSLTFGINLFLGWTLIGWLIALYVALRK